MRERVRERGEKENANFEADVVDEDQERKEAEFKNQEINFFVYQ